MKLLGLNDEATSLIWITSPILGLLIGPFIGSFSVFGVKKSPNILSSRSSSNSRFRVSLSSVKISLLSKFRVGIHFKTPDMVQKTLISIKDRCAVKLGRRRPFIIFLCLFAIIGMTLLTFAPYMINLIGIESALIVAIIGSQMMDWGLDATETPFRAYTLDCVPKDDQTSAFNIQTFLTGLGGGFGFAMAGAFGIEKREELYYVAIVFITISLGLTLVSFKGNSFD